MPAPPDSHKFVAHPNKMKLERYIVSASMSRDSFLITNIQKVIKD